MLEHLSDIRARLEAKKYPSEADVSSGIVQRVLQALSWPIFDTQIVSREYPLGGRFVDFALCSGHDGPLIFIEVKRVGQILKGDQQLFEYAFMKGVPMAVLTDGREWHFYLPGERGSFHERRVYLLDLLERELSESADRLQRYLEYRGVLSGAALEAARSDYRNAAKERLVQSTLPEAWRKLVEDEDERLVEIISDKVESLCGYKPDASAIVRYLSLQALPNSDQNYSRAMSPAAPLRPQDIRPPRATRSKQVLHTGPDQAQGSFGFVLEGQIYSAGSAADVLVRVFECLTLRDSTFPERFAELHRGRTRNYVARQREGLNPSRPDLAAKNSHQFAPGWWINTYMGTETIDKLIRRACEVAGIRYGTELKLHLPSLQSRSSVQ